MTNERLAEDPDLYFVRSPGARLMPLAALSPTKPATSQPESVDRAESLMRAAACGDQPRRLPISVAPIGDGQYLVIDGNATLAVAQRHGWNTILVTEEKQMDLGTFFIDQLVVHDVPKHTGSATVGDIVFSQVASALTPDLRMFFREKMIQSLSRNQYSVVREEGHSSPVPGLLASMVDDASKLVTASQEVAKHLFAAQTAVNPAGLLVVCLGKVSGQPGVGILKLEREDAIRVEQIGATGARTFNIIHLRDLMLGKNTRLFKASLFIVPDGDADRIEGCVSDDQRGYDPHSEIAQFFLNKFLGCRMKDQADLATKAIFEASQDWINTVPDEPKRARYEIALQAYMNTPSKEISLKEFADGYLDVEDRTPYKSFTEERHAPTAKIVKDTGLVETLLRQMTMAMADSKIRIVGTPDAIGKNVQVNPDGDDDPKVTIAGRLGGVRGGGR